MKIQWQNEDIRAGRVVGKRGRTERWMIGYLTGIDPGPPNRCWTLISMSDGMVQPGMSIDGIVQALNSSTELPAEML